MKRLVPIILLSAVLMIAAGMWMAHGDPSTPYTSNQDAWKTYEEGEFLLQAFRYVEAEEKLLEAIALDPDLAMARIAMAELQIRMRNKDSYAAHYSLADSLTALVKDDKARLLLEIRLSNASVSRYHAFQDSLLALGQEQAPDDLIILLTLAYQAEKDNDLEARERIYNRILEINPSYAGAYNSLGYLYLNQGRYDEAETAMRRYAFVAPDLANPNDSLGEVLLTIGRFEEAEVQFRTALAKQPDFYASLLNICQIYVARGEIDRAAELVEQNRELLKNTTWKQDIDLRYIYSLFEHRVTDELDRTTARYLAEHNPDDHPDTYRRVLIRRYIGLGQLGSAIAFIDSSASNIKTKEWYKASEISRHYADIEINRYRALVAEGMQDYAQAAHLFKSCIDAAEGWPPHHLIFDRVHLAYNLVPLRAYDEARIQINDAIKVNTRIAEAALVAASIEAAAGETTKARLLLNSVERMMELADPDFPVLNDAQALREQLPDPDRI